MPKTARGKEIMAQFEKEYGPLAGVRAAYAVANKQGGKLYKELHGKSKPKGRKTSGKRKKKRRKAA